MFKSIIINKNKTEIAPTYITINIKDRNSTFILKNKIEDNIKELIKNKTDIIGFLVNTTIKEEKINKKKIKYKKIN
jgi:hypothetical protein